MSDFAIRSIWVVELALPRNRQPLDLLEDELVDRHPLMVVVIHKMHELGINPGFRTGAEEPVANIIRFPVA